MRRYKRYILRVLLALGVIFFAVVGWNGYELWSAWRGIERFEFDLAETRELLPEVPAAVAEAAIGDGRGSAEPAEDDAEPAAADAVGAAEAILTAEDSEMDVFLLLGSDEDKPSAVVKRADAIMVFIRPKWTDATLLTSFPRDLLLPNRCTGELSRISVLLDGCGAEITGPELLALTVEDFTGLAVDHFAVLSFNAFTAAVDELGGVELCIDTAMRLHPTELTAVVKPVGCSLFTGADALGWVRDRTPEIFVDGAWRPAPGGDQGRSLRQQALMIELLRRLARVRSPLELTDIAEDLAGAFALDDTLSLAGAIDLAWDFRRIDPAQVKRPVLAVVNTVTEDGEFAWLADQSFADMIKDAYDAA